MKFISKRSPRRWFPDDIIRHCTLGSISYNFHFSRNIKHLNHRVSIILSIISLSDTNVKNLFKKEKRRNITSNRYRYSIHIFELLYTPIMLRENNKNIFSMNFFLTFFFTKNNSNTKLLNKLILIKFRKGGQNWSFFNIIFLSWNDSGMKLLDNLILNCSKGRGVKIKTGIATGPRKYCKSTNKRQSCCAVSMLNESPQIVTDIYE